MDRDTEIRLIRQSADDSGAFSELFEEHYDRILRYCIYHTAQVEIARDITAETFYKALKNIRKYHLSSAPFSSWLYRIAGNEVVDFFRKKKYRHKLLAEAMEREDILSFESRKNLQDEAELLQCKIDENKAYQTIRQLMENMPMHYRDVLVLRFIEEKSISEIGSILGKKEGTVKSLISRGIAALRAESLKNVQLHSELNVNKNKAVLKESLY